MKRGLRRATLTRVAHLLRNRHVAVTGGMFVVALGFLAWRVAPWVARAVGRSRLAWLGDEASTNPSNVPQPGVGDNELAEMASHRPISDWATAPGKLGGHDIDEAVFEPDGSDEGRVPVSSQNREAGTIVDIEIPARHAHPRQVIGTLATVASVMLAVWVVTGAPDISGTLAEFVASQINPGGSIQSGTVRLLGDASTYRGMTFPALLPGESVEQTFTLENGGTLDANLSLTINPNDGSNLTTDPVNGITLSVDRCSDGQWVVTTPVAGVPTPPADGQKYVCSVNSAGNTPLMSQVYAGPLVPRGESLPGQATSTVIPVQVAPNLSPGSRAAVRLRVSLPTLQDQGILSTDQVTSDTGQLAGLVLEWRAVGGVSNVSGTPLATPIAVPVTSTPRTTVSTTATASSTASASPTATSTATSIATVTVTPSATPPTASYAGYALSFDGQTDDLWVGGAGTVKPVSLTGRDQWAIETWLRPSVLSGSHALYTENITLSDGTEGMITGVGLQDRSVVVGVWNDTRTTEDKWAWNESLLPFSLQPGQWFHVAVSYQSGAVSILVNGNSLPVTASGSQLTQSPPTEVPSKTYIGRAGNVDLNSNFVGEMDEFRVWTTARSVTAIAQARFQKQLGNEAGLALYYPMSALSATADGRGAVVADRSVTGADGRLEGGLRWIVSGVQVDVPPTPNNLALLTDPSSDSGTIGDGITNFTTVGITGRADPGDRITFFRQATSLPTAPSTIVTSAGGSFSATLALLANQTNQLTAVATNERGESSLLSAQLLITVDTVAPNVPTVVLTSPDTGTSDSDRVTNALPVFGVSASTDSTITVSATRGGTSYVLGGDISFPGTGSQVLYSPSAPAGGLPDGVWQFTFVARDAAGNASNPVLSSVTFDTAAPVTPTIQMTGGGTTTTDTTPTFSGTAEAGSRVEFLSGSTITATTAASVSGAFSISSPALALGNYSFTVKSTDIAGNETTSATVVITVERVSGPDYRAPVVWSRSGQISAGGSTPHSWTAPSSGWVIFGTCGSDFDTFLKVAESTNDDHDQGADFCSYRFASYVRLQVNSGTTYAITLSGFASSAGAYIIEVRYG